MSSKPRVTRRTILTVQFATLIAFIAAWYSMPGFRQEQVLSEITRRPMPLEYRQASGTPDRITPLYDDPQLVSDEELAAVLKKVLPRFDNARLRPNYVEHALRIWGDDIEFQNPQLISGPRMREFLTDTSRYLDSWNNEADPILQSERGGVSIRWGSDRSASVHHDHLLACLTEAGVDLTAPVMLPGRAMQFQDILNQALRDFQLDERETEWSVMAFGLWLAPQNTFAWHNQQGRRIDFNLLADRLMRNHRKHGVCLGTHRVYSLMVLLRLDEQYQGLVINDETEQRIRTYLSDTRELITAAQDPDGSWPPNWTDGAQAAEKRDPHEKKKSRVISTGHHLEWLAIAPTSLHPSPDRIRAAARWAIQDVLDTPQAFIDDNYTFYSHVGNALALWRRTSPPEFWMNWRTDHPNCEQTSADEGAYDSQE